MHQLWCFGRELIVHCHGSLFASNASFHTPQMNNLLQYIVITLFSGRVKLLAKIQFCASGDEFAAGGFDIMQIVEGDGYKSFLPTATVELGRKEILVPGSVPARLEHSQLLRSWQSLTLVVGTKFSWLRYNVSIKCNTMTPLYTTAKATVDWPVVEAPTLLQ